MRNTLPITVILSLATAIPTVAGAAVDFANPPSRGKNALGFSPESSESDWTLLVNHQDCIENLDVRIWIEDDGAGSGDLYLARGNSSDCSSTVEDLDDCDLIDDAAAGGNGFYIGIRELLGYEDANDCSGTGDEELRVAKLEDKDEGAGYWSSHVITIDYDFEPPDAPEGIDAKPGDKKVVVSWETGEVDDAGSSSGDGLDDDVDRIKVIYDSSFSDQLVDIGGEDTADGATDTEPDGGVADGLTGDMTFRAATADTDTDADTSDTSPQECTTGGGFEEGGAYSADFKGKTSTTPSTGELTVGGLNNGTYYRIAAVAVDDHDNPSALSNVVCATPDETVNFFDVYKDAGGKGGKFCFVATAAFGDYDHPVVQVLRAFRDRFLAELPGGSRVISAYYDVGPDLAAVVSNRPVLKTVTVAALTLFAVFTIPLSLFGPIGMLLISFSLVCTGLVISRRRRK